MFFFFNDTATTEIYTLSLHDALPISLLEKALTPPLPERIVFLVQAEVADRVAAAPGSKTYGALSIGVQALDRKSTRLNSSHGYISYAVFCLKKKKKNK